MVGPKAKGGSMYPQRSLQQGTARRQGHSEVVQEKGVHKQENLVILKRLAPTTKSRASGSRSCGAAQKLSLKATKTRRNEAKRGEAKQATAECNAQIEIGSGATVDALARASASAPFSPKAQHEMASGLDPSEHEQPCSSACPTPKSKLNFHSSSPSLVAFVGLGNG